KLGKVSFQWNRCAYGSSNIIKLRAAKFKIVLSIIHPEAIGNYRCKFILRRGVRCYLTAQGYTHGRSADIGPVAEVAEFAPVGVHKVSTNIPVIVLSEMCSEAIVGRKFQFTFG